ncbi:hypothetical protein D8674_021581 [Pyrus ussuriensis x Pyrus communis]|uniref:Uncharacterized protein n=1 Tax=Pyrus ussuriensis x Pyrus communis TaxID=2448454 RepID=A0A5N5GJG3_9ROSA|nr:hypothetical protein D8674_021581 [Pyrus ussuriensis x Pyrus communis]
MTPSPDEQSHSLILNLRPHGQSKSHIRPLSLNPKVGVPNHPNHLPYTKQSAPPPIPSSAPLAPTSSTILLALRNSSSHLGHNKELALLPTITSVNQPQTLSPKATFLPSEDDMAVSNPFEALEGVDITSNSEIQATTSPDMSRWLNRILGRNVNAFSSKGFRQKKKKKKNNKNKGATIKLLVLNKYNCHVNGWSLWANLCSFRHSIGDSPWILLGYFNVVRFTGEIDGGLNIRSNAIIAFGECLLDVGLDDLRYSSQFLTWCNRQFNGMVIHRKLDHVLVKQCLVIFILRQLCHVSSSWCL